MCEGEEGIAEGFELGIIAGGEGAEGDFFVACGANGFFGGFDEGFEGAFTDGTASKTGLAETAATGAATEELECDAIMNCFHIGDD